MRKRLFLAFAGAFVAWGLQAHAAEEPVNGLTQARDRYAAALAARDWRTLAPMIWTFQLDAAERDRVLGEFRRRIDGDGSAGVVLQGERIRRRAVHEAGPLMLGVLDLSQSYSNPLDPGRPFQTDTRVYAVSSDHGSTWRFNVLDCVGDDTIRRLFPSLGAAPL